MPLAVSPEPFAVKSSVLIADSAENSLYCISNYLKSKKAPTQGAFFFTAVNRRLFFCQEQLLQITQKVKTTLSGHHHATVTRD